MTIKYIISISITTECINIVLFQYSYKCISKNGNEKLILNLSHIFIPKERYDMVHISSCLNAELSRRGFNWKRISNKYHIHEPTIHIIIIAYRIQAPMYV